jgi:hypothetical protein
MVMQMRADGEPLEKIIRYSGLTKEEIQNKIIRNPSVCFLIF